ncbi:hypothetical protein WN55_11413 [Dufourea novaeangliae]|uniref:DUF7041 domain-containing protein n=1 Tax=Dufourea novaeangliae TaxID=178035 RepID=A0A154PCM2_DUFNO|nr:hypothetical protein WN55_11413 [Dufourea novaeangliae]
MHTQISYIINQQSLRIPQFWPHKIALWFRLVDVQFAMARITKDETKYNITVANLRENHIEHVEDIVINSPALDRYEHLKRELIKRLTESDSTRVRRLLEGEEIGDRTPSQFFRDLKKLATPSIPDDFVLTLWKSRLPPNTQRVLAASTDPNITSLTEMADRVYEIRPEPGRIASVVESGGLDELQEQIRQLRLEVSALSGNRRRAPSRPRRRNRSHIREKEDQDDVCWYHRTFKDRATKCRAPCNWTGNEKSRP